ncbi:E3 ubiquitin-protein ligase E3D-like [Mercenaria mercenaria]|uniref:E3 ubiquitin-protein ligase E3D-like n=1 Tax=Mercenaria mercenaria TaxID=6596 RepID=UPI00234EF7D8|nr:E3 ubiquitin-protein ligase E3D-like [Mercenaria mercenaria]
MDSVHNFPKFFATWSSSSNILNCILESNWLDQRVDVTVEPEHVIISSSQNGCKFLLRGITLLPDTCRGLKMLNTEELHFSMKGNLSVDDDVFPMKRKKCSSQTETVDTIQRLQNKWYCGVCKQKILTDRCILSRVLPLPSENWSEFADMWFCHNHGNQEESSQKQGRLLPKAKECFVGETYVLVARRHVNNVGIKVTKSGTVICRRCGRQIGEAIESENGLSKEDSIIKFFLHTLLMKDLAYADLIKSEISNGHRVDLNGFFSGLLQEQSDTYASFRFIIESQCDGLSGNVQDRPSSTCLLWMLDSMVQMYRSSSVPDSDGNIQVTKTDVTKIMFKCQLGGLCANRSPDYVTKSVISLWKKDNTVHGFRLPHPVFLQLINLLLQNCKTLPASQRYLNGFHMSFIENSKVS